MAFRLKAGEISPVFESDFGFHFLQVIERRGEQVHVRHILITPVVTQGSLDRAQHKADSVYTLIIKNKQIDFSSAAAYYSDNKDTKYNGGMLLNDRNVENRSTFIPTDQLDPQMALTLDTMKLGGIAKPQLYTAQDGKKSYKILFLRSATNAHKANLEQDFPKLKELAQNQKENRTASEWFEKRRKETFIRIDPDYQSCSILKSWVVPGLGLAALQPAEAAGAAPDSAKSTASAPAAPLITPATAVTPAAVASPVTTATAKP